MARKPDDAIYVARATGVVRIGDTEYRYISGKTRVRSGHPLLGVFPGKFRAEPPDTEKIAAIPSIESRRRSLRAAPPAERLSPALPLDGVEVPADVTFSDPIEGDPDGEPSHAIEEA